MKHINMLSGGLSSAEAGYRIATAHGTADLVHLFADTLIEDPDLYRFMAEFVTDCGGKFVRLADGRDPWQIFHDERFIGNTRKDPCSKILKRQILRKWLNEHCEPENTIVYLGMDWTEMHRLEKALGYWAPWRVEAPLMEPPHMMKERLGEQFAARGIAPPTLYGDGFVHNNCGGFCIKAGQAQFARLLEKHPDRYAHHEQQEQGLRAHLGKDVAILRDRRGGTTKPMTLMAFRQRLEAGKQYDIFDWGGCGCFTPSEGE